MNKVLETILSITRFIVFVRLYQKIKPLVKIIFCDHVYQTWDMRLDASDSQDLKRFHGEVFKDAFRKCVNCDKQAEALSMIPGQFGWKKTYRELPKNKTVIGVEVIGFNEETKAMKRDRVINSILK
jgi:hypothetical protein